VNRRALHVGVESAAYQIAKWLERGDAAAWHRGVAPKGAGQLGVIRQGPAGVKPAMRESDLPHGLQLARPIR
jgi:hypothetical protein